MLVELGVVDQRLSAVHEVLNDGVTVTEVAERAGCPARRCIGGCAYTTQGLAGLLDGSSVPGSCPHQMAPVIEREADQEDDHAAFVPPDPSASKWVDVSN